MPLEDLQDKVRSSTAFPDLGAYMKFAQLYLKFVAKSVNTRIVSPSTKNYIFFQYGRNFGDRITRPLNTDLFVETPLKFDALLPLFDRALTVIRDSGNQAKRALTNESLKPQVLDQIVYTMQQSIGAVADSFTNPNQSRKRVGMLFERLVSLIINRVGVACEPRTVSIPLPGHPGRRMSYQLDLVFSRGNAIVAKEHRLIGPHEIVGSVKTTSKDRFDKIFLDKYLLSKLLARDVRVVAIFLHDVQRAVRRKGKRSGEDPFAINSTFKSNHFLGYTLALNRLDGVYYVDPRPLMTTSDDFAREIGQFSSFLTRDLWRF